jgi:predicted Zn-dependent peptidase
VRLHLAPSRKFKTLVLRVLVRTDLKPESATEVGCLPYVLRHGTRSMPSRRELNQHLESLYGAGLGIDVLKLGEQQVLSLSIEMLGDRYLPAGEEILPAVIRVLSDLLLDPALDEAGALRADAVDQEREALTRYIQGLKNDKGSYAHERCLQEMCRGEPYATFEYGTLEALAAVTGADLEARRRALLAEAEIDVYAAGAVEPERARELISAAFDLDRAGPASLRGTTPHPDAGEVREVREPMPSLVQAKLCMGLRVDPGPTVWDLLLMNGVLGGFPHSKLFRHVREELKLCYDAGSSLERTKRLLYMSAGIEPDKLDQTRSACLAQLEAMARGEFAEDDLEKTRLAYVEGYEALLDSTRSVTGYDYMCRLLGVPTLPADAIAGIQAVDSDAVQAAAQAVRLDTVYFLEPEAVS